MPAAIALQLYTVRNAIAQSSFAAVLRQVAQYGYSGVEPAGFPGTTPRDAAKLFHDLGLQVCGVHAPLPLGDQQKEVLDTMHAIGCRRLVTGKGPDDFKTVEGIKTTAGLFNQAAAVAREHGLSIAMHNHWWEFLQVDGQSAFDILLEHLSPDVLLEVDTYWVQTAGADPVAELQKIGDRAPLLHIKDGPCQQGVPMTAVGTGQMDFAAISRATAKTAQWWIVELDDCATDMMEAVCQSYHYITAQGFAKGRK